MDNLKNEVKDAPAFNLADLNEKVNVDSVLSMLKLQSPGRIDSLKEESSSNLRSSGSLSGLSSSLGPYLSLAFLSSASL